MDTDDDGPDLWAIQPSTAVLQDAFVVFGMVIAVQNGLWLVLAFLVAGFVLIGWCGYRGFLRGRQGSRRTG